MRHIAPQDRREVGIDHRRVAAANQLDQRRDFVADRNLRKAHLARERGHAFFMIGVAVGMHENDRDRLDAIGLGCLQIRAHRREIGLALDRAVGAHALIDFNDALVEHVRLDDVPGKNFRPRLVADLECVAETFGDRAAAVRSPLRSSSALVATVVPIFTAPTWPAGIASPAFSPSRSRMPCTAASA